MKAIILAAGKGTRLRHISEQIPKPMLMYKGKPILEHNIDLCKKYNIKDIYINTHYLPSYIKDYFGDGSQFDVSISYTYENKLLGTAGAVRNFQSSIGEENFFVIYGDNYSNINLTKLIDKKLSINDAIGVIAFHYREDVSESGVAEFDEFDSILRFIEKPKVGDTNSHWVNAGIYYCSPEIFNYIPEGFSDFGRDIFPEVLKQSKQLYGLCIKSDVLAFDTVDMYNKNIDSEIR